MHELSRSRIFRNILEDSSRMLFKIEFLEKLKGVKGGGKLQIKRSLPLIMLVFSAFMLISPVFACGACEVTITKEPLYSGYTKPDGTWVDSAPTSGLQLFTHYEWWVRIQICTPDTITNVRLYDRFGAEFGVDIVEYRGGSGGSPPVIRTKGKSEKVFLEWQIGTLEGGQCAAIFLHVWTDHNPAGKQEFTSYGTYEMNSGAVVKWFDSFGKQHSAETASIVISTVEPPSM